MDNSGVLDSRPALKGLHDLGQVISTGGAQPLLWTRGEGLGQVASSSSGTLEPSLAWPVNARMGVTYVSVHVPSSPPNKNRVGNVPMLTL